MAARRTTQTRKDDLRTGTPLWVRTPRITPDAGPLPARRRWDVVVVGAGISGALMAERLSRMGKAVLIVDRRDPVRGSTPASTAMIQHEIDVPLTDHIRRMGKPAAEAAWRRSVAAVHGLVDLAQSLGIDCAMQPKQALYLTGGEMGARAMRAEAEARQAAGIEAEFLNAPALRERFGLDRTGAIVSTASASANPAQLAAGLLMAAQARGAEIASPVEITDLAETRDAVALATAQGEVLIADHAVFCTGYEFLPVMESAAHSIISTWALASQPRTARPAWLDDFLVWEAADPYLYFRSTPDGRIVVGGEDEDNPTGNDDPSLLQRKADRIAAKLRELTEIEIAAPAYVWSAPFGNTTDGLPIIDRVPGHERSFAVMGFGGNGITFSMIAAELIGAEIAGRPDPDARLFRFR